MSEWATRIKTEATKRANVVPFAVPPNSASPLRPLLERGAVKVLVEDYLKFGGQPISLVDVRLHELLLLLYWLEEAWREYQKPVTRGHGPDYYKVKLQSLFRRTAS